MKRKSLNGLSVEYWDSVEDLPIGNYKMFQLYLMIDAGVGADIEAVHKHHRSLINHIERDEKKEALGVINNLSQAYAFIISGVNPKCMAFTCLVHSINGERWNDISEEGSKRLMETLSTEGATWGWMSGVVDLLKKKFEIELVTFFPELDSDLVVREFFSKVKKRSIAMLYEIINGQDMTKKIQKLESDLVAYFKPKEYGGHEGYEVIQKLNLIKVNAVMSQHISRDVTTMATVEYLGTLDTLKKQLKKSKYGKV